MIKLVGKHEVLRNLQNWEVGERDRIDEGWFWKGLELLWYLLGGQDE